MVPKIWSVASNFVLLREYQYPLHSWACNKCTMEPEKFPHSLSFYDTPLLT